MPLFGTLDLDAALEAAPTVATLKPEPWSMPGAEVLQVSYEVAEASSLAITPPGLHPSIPPYATFSVLRIPVSPVGPFNLAMVRLIVRAGIRPRGLLVAGFASTEAAADALAAGWGFKARVADVSFSRRHDHTTGTVVIDGVTALEARLHDPEPIGGADIELFDNLHLMNVDGGDPVIAQVDPVYSFTSADRGRADLAVYHPELLGTLGIDPVYKLIAVVCGADIELAAPRFVMDPRKPAFQGTRRLS